MLVHRSVLNLVIVYGLVAAGPAAAQTSVQFRPSLSVTQAYDSNLFSAPSARAGDVVLRLTPGAEAEYRSPLWKLTGRHSFDIERFANNSELNSMSARQHADAAWEYRPEPRLALGGTAEFSRTQNPGELNTLTGLAFTRAAAQRLGAQVWATRQLNGRTEGRIEYGLSRDQLAGDVGLGTELGAVKMTRRLRERSSASAGYRYRRFSFGSSSAVSHTLAVGWVHDLSPLVRLSLDGGPTLTSGSTSVDVNAAMFARSRAIDYSVAFTRTQTTALGLTGLVDTDTVTASASWRARRTLHVRITPAVYRSSQGSLDATVYRFAVSAIHAITPTLSLEASLDSRVQRGVLYRGFDGQTIPRQEVVIRLMAAPAAVVR